MTIAMADKLFTSFRFTDESKGGEQGLNSVFTGFIICILTETTISKSRNALGTGRTGEGGMEVGEEGYYIPIATLSPPE